jgi:hypothetical protein
MLSLCLNSRKKEVSHTKFALLYIWGERNHIWDLSHNQRKIKGYCIEDLKGFNLKLQEQKQNNKEHVWEKIENKIKSRNRIFDAKRLAYATIYQIGN